MARGAQPMGRLAKIAGAVLTGLAGAVWAQAGAATPPPASTPPVAPTAQPAAAVGEGEPKWFCAKEAFEFGTVWQSQKIPHVFEFENRGTGVMRILEVKPTCGCTLTPDYSREIAPGQKGKIEVVLNTDHLEADVKKDIWVTTNEPGARMRLLRMQGVVRPIFGRTPPEGHTWGRIAKADPLRAEITLSSNVSKPMKVALAKPLQPPFKAELREVQPGRVFKLVITADPPYKDGGNSTELILETGLEDAPTYRLYPSFYLMPRVETIPPQLMIDGNQRPAQVRTIKVTNNGTTPFDVLSAQSSTPELRVLLSVKQANRWDYQVIVPAFYRPPPQGEVITFKTTDREKPEIRVEVKPYGVPPKPETVELWKREQAAKNASSQAPAPSSATPTNGPTGTPGQ